MAVPGYEKGEVTVAMEKLWWLRRDKKLEDGIRLGIRDVVI